MKIEEPLFKEMSLLELEKYLNSFSRNKALKALTKAFRKYSKFRFNRFTKKDGIYTIDYYIPREFGNQDKKKQIANLKEDFIFMIEIASKKLKPKCAGYDFELLQEEIRNAIIKWK